MLRKIRQYGIFNSAKRILQRIFLSSFTTEQLFFKKLKKEDIASSSDSIQKLTYKNFKDNKSIFNLSEKKLLTFKKRFSKKTYTAFGFFIDDKLVYYTWISFSDFEPERYKKFISLANDQALLLDSRCLPEYRGRAIHTKMVNHRLEYCLKNNRPNVFVLVDIINIPALKVWQKLNFSVVKIFKTRKK